MNLVASLVLVLGLLNVGCAQASDDGMTMVSTVYYKPVIKENKHCPRSEQKSLIGLQKQSLAEICAKDYSNCAMQGSCVVFKEGKSFSFNYVGTIEGTFRFKETNIEKCPFGFGVRNSCLDPYFSVAADPAFYKFGDVIYVPVLDGVVLPDGQVHNGYLIVRDTGGMIKGKNRFDFFSGYSFFYDRNNPFWKLKIADPKSALTFKKASAVNAEKVRKARNFPGLPEAVLKDGLEMFSEKMKAAADVYEAEIAAQADDEKDGAVVVTEKATEGPVVPEAAPAVSK